VNEPTAKLIGIMDIERDGGGYKALDGSIFSPAATNGCRRSSPMSARRRDLGDRFLQLHHPAQSDAEHSVAGIQATTGAAALT
jgi:hypothetical protein